MTVTETHRRIHLVVGERLRCRLKPCDDVIIAQERAYPLSDLPVVVINPRSFGHRQHSDIDQLTVKGNKRHAFKPQPSITASYHLTEILVSNTQLVRPLKAGLNRESHTYFESHTCARLLHTLWKFVNAEIVPYSMSRAVIIIQLRLPHG